MFGFDEPEYAVIEAARRLSETEPGVQVTVELRKPSITAGVPYISILLTNGDGSVISDNLLFYADQNMAGLDWSMINSHVPIGFDDLHFNERVVDHHLGFLRDGSVVMY